MSKTKKNKENLNRYILQVYSQRPIAFIPVLAHISNSASAGLFLSQMLYWCGKGKDSEWVYKTIEEMKEETCLSRSEQQTAIKKWMQLGVLEKEVRKIPPKRHFRLNIPVLEKLLDVAFEIAQIDKTKSNDEQNTITESTSEKTYTYPSLLKVPTRPTHRI